MVPTWNNSGLHRSPPLAPVATAVSVWGASTTHLAAAFRLRHDASAFSLLGACIQDSSHARYRQGWAVWGEFILLYFGTSDFHTAVCGDGFRPLSLYGPAALLVVCRPDVKSRQSLLQGPWSVCRRTTIPSGFGCEACGPHCLCQAHRGSVPESEASFYGGHGSTRYPRPPCSGFRGGSPSCFGLSVRVLPLASCFRASSLATVYGRNTLFSSIGQGRLSWAW